MIGLLQRIVRTMQKAQERRVVRMQLDRMSDKELHDIGISRGMIREIVNGI